MDVKHGNGLVFQEVIEGYIAKKERGRLSFFIFVQIKIDVSSHQRGQMDNAKGYIRVLCVRGDEKEAVMHEFMEDFDKIHFRSKNYFWFFLHGWVVVEGVIVQYLGIGELL